MYDLKYIIFGEEKKKGEMFFVSWVVKEKTCFFGFVWERNCIVIWTEKDDIKNCYL